MTFFEFLASKADGSFHEVSTTFVVFATTSLLAFAVLFVMTARLVVDTWKALRRGPRSRSRSRPPVR